MDRRQRKTREAIFHGFTQLLAKKDFSKITVGEVIAQADVGRATFYAHFETKDFLLKEFCQELFCHLVDAQEQEHDHKHIFDCEGADSVVLHLFQHLQNNDNHILELLSSPNNQLFLQYFKENAARLIQRNMVLFSQKNRQHLPRELWENHLVSTLVETIRWWVETGLKESPQTITDYFFCLVS